MNIDWAAHRIPTRTTMDCKGSVPQTRTIRRSRGQSSTRHWRAKPASICQAYACETKRRFAIVPKAIPSVINRHPLVAKLDQSIQVDAPM